MCVAAVAWKAHPDWQLVAIGNRDEYHDRPAAPLARWQEPQGILAGQDLRSGGTWLGVSEEGRFALVTNLRGFGDPDLTLASRGSLMTGLLSSKGAYADARTANIRRFNPFNLIFADGDEAFFLSNRPEEVRSSLVPGVYGLSNSALDAPWPKTLQLKSALLDWLDCADTGAQDLLAQLRSESPADTGHEPHQRPELMDQASNSAPFIRNPVYGTRCSTVIAIDARGSGIAIERSFTPGGDTDGETSMAFRWPG